MVEFDIDWLFLAPLFEQIKLQGRENQRNEKYPHYKDPNLTPITQATNELNLFLKNRILTFPFFFFSFYYSQTNKRTIDKSTYKAIILIILIQ